MKSIVWLKSKQSWLVKALPLTIWIVIILVKLTIGIADPPSPPIPPPTTP